MAQCHQIHAVDGKGAKDRSSRQGWVFKALTDRRAPAAGDWIMEKSRPNAAKSATPVLAPTCRAESEDQS